MFRDRRDAGRMLAEELAEFAKLDDVVVYGIPRGGVIVAKEVAERLELPLDVVIASKIGAPGNPEYAIGAVDPDGEITHNEFSEYSLSELAHLGREAREKIAARLELYRAGAAATSAKGKTAILVDDGIATGLTTMAAADYLYHHGATEVIVAVPVVAADTADALRDQVDDVIAIEEPQVFYAVGQFYDHFEQTSDDEVMAALIGR